MHDDRWKSHTRIPAGKHAGKYRDGLDGVSAYTWRSKQNPKQNCDRVVCGTCRKKYKSMQFTCPHCGGPHGDDDEDSDTGVTHE